MRTTTYARKRPEPRQEAAPRRADIEIDGERLGYAVVVIGVERAGGVRRQAPKEEIMAIYTFWAIILCDTCFSRK